MNNPAETRIVGGEDEYLARMTKEDRQNLQMLGSAFAQVLHEQQRNGALIVVGGTLTKQLPRKDIDLIVILEGERDDSKVGEKSGYDLAMEQFGTLENLLREITTKTRSLAVERTQPPSIDEEYQNPNILKSDGSIILKSGNGTPIEIIRSPKKQTYEEFKAGEKKRPYILLERV